MKIFYLAIILILSDSVYCQIENNFEQNAFNYYKDSILSKEVKTKIKFVVKLQDYTFWKSHCLENYNIKWQDTMVTQYYNSNFKNINLGNDKRLKKVRNFNKKDSPKFFVLPHLDKVDTNQTFVIIVEKYESEILNFVFEMNSYGKVVSWCKGKWIDEN